MRNDILSFTLAGASAVSTFMMACGSPTDDGTTVADTSSGDGDTTDGDTTDGDTTGDGDTTEEACGNGLLDEGEECDNGSLNSDTGGCKTDCTFQVCGDGFVGEFESCDDGNTSDLDTCSSVCGHWPDTPTPDLFLSQIKTFELSWWHTPGAEYYQVFERLESDGEYVQLGDDIPFEQQQFFSVIQRVPLHFRGGASYRLRGCHAHGCVDSAAVDVPAGLTEAIGYFKASNADAGDRFGHAIALSSDASTLAVGAPEESSDAQGINGDQSDNSVQHAGAVYVFEDGVQQAYFKKGVPALFPSDDQFGYAVALSSDGHTLAVGAPSEDGAATGINGQFLPFRFDSGAVYVFNRVGGVWTQQAYIKASNTRDGAGFGTSLALSSNGSTLVVGAPGEASNAVGIDGNQADESAAGAGAVYVFSRNAGVWAQQAYVKASNTDAGDGFGSALALSAFGDTLAVGAIGERSNAVGIDGDQSIDVADNAGAVYVFSREDAAWAQDAYVKPHDINGNDQFGWSVSLAGAGNLLAVGSIGEDSDATGLGGISNSMAPSSGAVYLFGHDAIDGWMQHAYIKASNTEEGDQFGWSVALAPGGETLAVGAHAEQSAGLGVDADSSSNAATRAGAVYVFQGSDGDWAQRAYVKASNTNDHDEFGHAVALSHNPQMLVVAAPLEDGDTVGVGATLAEQASNDAPSSGAVYAY